MRGNILGWHIQKGNTMLEFIQSLNPKVQEVLILMGPVFLIGGIIAVVAILSHYAAKTRLSAWESGLKSQMIERGMTADEISKVLAAKAHFNAPPEKPDDVKAMKADPSANLAAYLTECWYSGEDVAKILAFVQQRATDPQNAKIDYALVRELANQSCEADDILRILAARQPAASN